MNEFPYLNDFLLSLNDWPALSLLLTCYLSMNEFPYLKVYSCYLSMTDLLSLEEEESRDRDKESRDAKWDVSPSL